MRSWSKSLSWMAAIVVALALPASVRAAEDDDFAAAKPAAPEAGAEASANGLEMKLVLKERSFRMGGGDGAAETKIKVLTLELKNVGDKPLVLDFQLSGGGRGGFGGFGGFGGRGGAEESPVKFFAKDAAGKEVPAPEQRDRAAQGEEQPKAEDRPVSLTILKPGQTIDQPVMGAIRFPAQGKYTVWAELDVPAKDEVLPGVKPWSGKIKSAELEYDYQGFGGGRGNRGARGNRGDNQNPPAAPAPMPDDKEAF